MRWLIAFTVLGLLLVPGGASAKGKHPGHGVIPCQRVFVVGNQIYAVQWADKNLFRHTCMAQQADPSRATAILVLEPVPGLVPDYTATPEQSSDYWVDCSGYGGSITCEDSDGHEQTTDCYVDRWGVVECSSYSGPNPIEALAKALVNLATRNAAYAYLYDTKTHKLLWKYEGTWQ
jgi:hypothetical protein